ncbi:MAG: magnesium chelatase [Thermoanaerobaculia bacterium]|nr:magnesium chelatase [Thermoanaerobaculia bacterium]
MAAQRPTTLGELRDSGYTSRSVKQEIRSNLQRRLRDGGQLFPGVLGYDRTVIPGVVNALLAHHDFILLGLRGQAKTRILRALTTLLDDEIPVLAGAPLNDDPLAPISPRGRQLVAEWGDEAAVEWLPRAARYQEKLATPDVSISDLIGDIDPIKAATQKLTYADPEVIHFGIIPRTNRGIFAINELPDLAPRIQVGLLNILEERDLQIRGFPIRIPLDVLLVFSANPEDYTHRGSIITPLKDRISSQILTHYPKDVEVAMEITQQEAWRQREDDEVIVLPEITRRLIEEISVAARDSDLVDPGSGVSARVAISALELLVSNLERRALATDDDPVYPRVADLHMVLPALTGKLEMVYEGEQQGIEMVAHRIIGQALSTVFQRNFPAVDRSAGSGGEGDTGPYAEILAWFADGGEITLSDTQPFAEYEAELRRVPGLLDLVEDLAGSPEGKALLAEIVLEGLHQHSKLARNDLDRTLSYKEMLKFQLLRPTGGRNSRNHSDEN